MQWVQHMLAYVTGDVLETRWKKLEDKLSKVSTIDQLLRDHVEYLDTCLKECTLTEGKLISVSHFDASRPGCAILLEGLT
jgi:gamma-tubulin complex component 2